METYEIVRYDSKELELLKEIEQTLTKERENYTIINQKLLTIKNRIPIFRDLEDGDFQKIVSHAKYRTLYENEEVVQQGCVSQEVFFILMGECKVLVNGYTVAYLKTNQVFGEIAAILNKPRTASVVASRKTKILSFQMNEKELDDHPKGFAILYKNLSKELSIKLEEANQELEKFMGGTR